MFDVKGKLPLTKKLSGIRSQEVNGEGFNQLRFDDTTGQISVQLQSSHGASQLNLGNLSHPKEDEVSDGRGEGFELRTDQWGAVRAGAGLLISTHKQENANANHLNSSPAKSQLESSFNNSKALSDVSKNQQTDPLEALDHLTNFLNQIEQQDQSKAETFKQALMVLCAPNSIALSTNEDLHLSADKQINHSAADSINFSTQKSLIAHAQDKISLFAAQQGLKAIAAKGKVEFQAQDDAIEAIARKQVKIISTEDQIEIISPEEIVLTAGGSQLKINGQGIFGTTGGKFECKAGQHLFAKGQNIVEQKISLPKMETLFSNKINYQWDDYSEGEKEIFIVDKKNGTLIKTKKSLLNEKNQLSTMRFYTSQQTDFLALGFNSSQTFLIQELDNEGIDELIDDIEEGEIKDEIYVKEDIE